MSKLCLNVQFSFFDMVTPNMNHDSTPKITLKYIGINKEEKDNVLDKFHI